MVLKGPLPCSSHNLPVKIVIPQGFPFHPPKVYLDMQIPIALLKTKTYLGDMNAIKIPYLHSWPSSQSMQQKPNLADMLGFIQAIMASDPPVEQGLNAAMGNFFGN